MSLSSPLLGMFGRSPIKPLEKHMQTVLQCASELIPFCQALMAGNQERILQLRDSIAAQEREADNIKQDLRLHLPNSLFLPVARGDLLEILTLQDKIANKAKDISGLIVGRSMKIPEAISHSFEVLLKRCIDAVFAASQIVNELDQLLETGFRGNEVQVVEKMIVDLDIIEHETDDYQVQVRHDLFAIENTLPPVDVIFLYKIIEWSGDLADCAQSVGRQLQLLLAR